MPRFPRNYLDTNYFHIMSQGINRSYIFEDPIDIKVYIKNMYAIKEKYNVKIIAYCIMNNHTHILLEVDKVENLGKYMQSLNTRYGQYYNKKYKRVGYVFRDRYKAQGIYNEEELNRCIEYIYDNPVKAGICKRPEEYKFSNYNKNIIKANKSKDNFIIIDIEDNKEEICEKVVSLFLNEKGIRKENIIEAQNKKADSTNQENSKTSFLSREEIQTILGPDDAYFCIEDLEKSGDEYIITAVMLEKVPRLVSKAEFEDLKNGKEIEFRGQKWTLQDGDNNSYTLHSGNDSLFFVMHDTYGIIGNLAGVAADLPDYSDQKITFKVSQDILIGDFWAEFKYDSNGQLIANGPDNKFDGITFNELLSSSEGCRGSYDECKAYVKDGVVDAIQIFNK